MRLALLLPSVVASCGGDVPDTPLPDFEVRDSAGVPIVWSAIPEVPDSDARSIAFEPSLVIGRVEGEEAYLLNAIGDVVEYPDGRIAVVDEQTVDIRVFSPEGAHLWTRGGRGEGPGEFSAPPTLALAPPDTLVAWDGRTRRITWFDGRGESIRERSLRETMGVLGITSGRGTVLPDGSLLVGDRDRTEEREGRTMTVWRPVLLRTPDDAPVPIGDFPDDLYGQVRSEQRTVSVLAPFGHAIWTAADARGGFVLTPVRAWELRRFGPDGSLVRVVRAAVPRLPVTAAMVESEAQERAERMGQPVTVIREAYDRIGVPDSLPAIGGIVTASDGGVWVRRYDTAPERPSMWDVFDAEGRWLQTFRLPFEMGEILAVGRARVFLLWRDELDVPYLRVHELVRG